MGRCSTLWFLIPQILNKKLEGQETRRLVVIVAALTILVANNRMLNKNLATSFTSTSPSELLPAIQTSLISLDAICFIIRTNLGNYNIRYYIII